MRSFLASTCLLSCLLPALITSTPTPFANSASSVDKTDLFCHEDNPNDLNEKKGSSAGCQPAVDAASTPVLSARSNDGSQPFDPAHPNGNTAPSWPSIPLTIKPLVANPTPTPSLHSATSANNNITCYPEFASNVRHDIGGICTVWHAQNCYCEFILTLEVLEGRHGSDYPMNFTKTQVVEAGNAIMKGCVKGGKKYIPTPGRENGQGGWYAEVTAGWSAA